MESLKVFGLKGNTFWSKVSMRDPKVCWNFDGYKNEDGYGIIYVMVSKKTKDSKVCKNSH